MSRHNEANATDSSEKLVIQPEENKSVSADRQSSHCAVLIVNLLYAVKYAASCYYSHEIYY